MPSGPLQAAAAGRYWSGLYSSFCRYLVHWFLQLQARLPPLAPSKGSLQVLKVAMALDFTQGLWRNHASVRVVEYSSSLCI